MPSPSVRLMRENSLLRGSYSLMVPITRSSSPRSGITSEDASRHWGLIEQR
ncbi:Uncharacterised protein [Chromobacterium violaceum]|uniref:Uncharacterized protein n=1 Tax=Chromobacterium violaceum TaxID=536 RepID=A0A447TAK6_CHRVL|nr:Uncharacterised protein [Chromobacterium violaceum]